MTLVVGVADVRAVRPLRNRVLRPNDPDDSPAYDADPTAIHVAARQDGVVVACATVFPNPLEGEPTAWQLRGMAVAPERQGEGIGRLVVEAAVDQAKRGGARLLWANARTTAVGFYERAGWRAVGEEYVYGPMRLPHYLIQLPLG